MLDEADRLLEAKSFEPELRRIAHKRFAEFPIHLRRQTILTTATWTPEIEKIAKTYMINPVKIQVGKLDLSPAKSVDIKIIKVIQGKRDCYLIGSFIFLVTEMVTCIFLIGYIFSVPNCKTLIGEKSSSDSLLPT